MANPINFERYHHWLDEGRSFTDIRADLERKGLSEAEIGLAIGVLDREQQTRNHKKRGHNTGKEAYYAGIALIGITILLNLFTLIQYQSVVIWTFIPAGIGGALFTGSKLRRSS